MKGFLIALQFLTRLPVPCLSVSKAEFSASMRWFPAVGLLIGLIVAGGAWAGARADPWAGALIALVLWVGVTGALHLDGLGDIADACGAAHKDKDRMIATLADPHMGSFAVVVIGLQLLSKLVLLYLLIGQQAWAALVLIPAAARFAPLVWARWLPSLHEGLGAQFRHAVRPGDLAIWGALLLAGALFTGAYGLLVWPALVLLWGRWIKRNIGGLSGDGHGAGIEMLESGLMLCAFLSPAAPFTGVMA